MKKNEMKKEREMFKNHEKLVSFVRRGKTNLVNRMAENGMGLKHTYEFGDSLLHMAAREGFADTVEFLLDSGLDINAKNGHGQTPLMMIAEAHHMDVLRVLLDHGADENLRDKYGRNVYDLLEISKGNPISASRAAEMASIIFAYGEKKELTTDCGTPHNPKSTKPRI